MDIKKPIFLRSAQRTFPVTAILLLLLLANVAVAEDFSAIRKRQEQIQQVVQKNMGAVVAVTDGIGFGSGVIVSKDGLVLTAGHVMANSGSNYKVILANGKELKAKPLGKNLNVDAGMVKIDVEGDYPFVELGDKKAVKLGEWAVCLGHPGGFEIGRTAPVRAGKILQVNQNDLVTDCALIGGDSGGPLFDLDGKLIGIHSSIGNHIALNRHVSIDVYQTHWKRMESGERWGVLPELRDRSPSPKRKKSSRAGLGVTLEPSDSQAKIIGLRSNSPANRVGMKEGDLIVEFEGQKITSSKQLIELIKQKSQGESVSIKILRNGNALNYRVILSDLNSN